MLDKILIIFVSKKVEKKFSFNLKTKNKHTLYSTEDSCTTFNAKKWHKNQKITDVMKNET